MNVVANESSSRKQVKRSDANSSRPTKSRSANSKSLKSSSSGARSSSDPQPSTSSGSSAAPVKIEDEDGDLQDLHLDSDETTMDDDDAIEAPSREESDDNVGFESKPMRMNTASALTFGHNSRSGFKDVSVQTFHEQHDAQRSENVKVKSYLKDKLECPVCSRIALPPIMQCRNGHLVCNLCRHKVR